MSDHTFGRPRVVNDGVIELGMGVVVSSIPVPTHIRVAAGARLRIGSGVTISHGVGINVTSEIVIEDGVVIGPFVTIMDTDFHGVGARDAAAGARPIHIGRGVRLGAGVIVLRGVTIASDAEIVAGSVVARSISRRGLHRGVPAHPCGRLREVVIRDLERH